MPSLNYSGSETITCRRCGTCCTKGGPALHLEDLSLLRSKILSESDLYTLRIGEPVYDQILDQVVLLESECVKIRSVQDSTACIFFGPNEYACCLYASRPVECRALQCWDIRHWLKISRQARLTRFEIVGAESAPAELIREHEARCGCADLLELLGQDTHEARRSLRDAKAYDAALRNVLVERGVNPQGLEFLLGRPLDTVILGLVRYRSLKVGNNLFPDKA
jgi:Fe-S-cluster containining protein